MGLGDCGAGERRLIVRIPEFHPSESCSPVGGEEARCYLPAMNAAAGLDTVVLHPAIAMGTTVDMDTVVLHPAIAMNAAAGLDTVVLHPAIAMGTTIDMDTADLGRGAVAALAVLAGLWLVVAVLLSALRTVVGPRGERLIAHHAGVRQRCARAVPSRRDPRGPDRPGPRRAADLVPSDDLRRLLAT